MTRGLTSSVQLPGNWWGHNATPAYKLTGDNVSKATAAMPDATRAGIVAEFKRQGVAAPSETLIQNAYMTHLRPDLAGSAAPQGGH